MLLSSTISRQTQAGWAISSLATAAATLVIDVIYRFQPVPNISLVYVPVVLGCAMLFGLGPSLLAAVLCVAEYDFFLLEPKLTFTVSRLEDGLSLLVLCVVGAAAAHLASTSSKRASAAEERASEGIVLNELSEALISAEGLAEVLERIAQLVVRVFHPQSCFLLLPEADGILRRTAGSDTSTRLGEDQRSAFSAASHAFRQGTEVSIPLDLVGRIAQTKATAQYIPLKGDSGTVGVMEVIWHVNRPRSSGEDRLLASFSTQAAMAIDRARAQEARSRMRILEETDRLKSSLLSAVSHDLRTPLASIKASVTSLILSDQDWLPQERLELLEAIDHEADRLDRLVGNVLDASRIESGVLVPLLDWYDIRELLDSAAAEASRYENSRRICIEIAPDVTLVHVDLVLIRQALVNLLENAARYTRPQSEITLSAGQTDDLLILQVIDHGEGVPPNWQDRVFMPFVRPRGHSDRDSGVGLGLAICRGIAKAHTGQIFVRDTEGGGATFVLEIPRAPLPSQVLALP